MSRFAQKSASSLSRWSCSTWIASVRAFDQPQPQHQRHRPEFADVQRGHRLERGEESPDCLHVQRAIAFGHDLRRDPVNARQARLRAAGNDRQLLVIHFRKAPPDFVDLSLNQIRVIQQPLRGKREGVMHVCRHRQAGVRPFENPPGLFQSDQQRVAARPRSGHGRERMRQPDGLFREALARWSFIAEQALLGLEIER